MTDIRFIVSECYVDIGGVEVNIIYKTCYSRALGAQLLSARKDNTASSRFKYKLFGLNSSADLSVSTTLICTIKLCLNQPYNCGNEIIQTTSDCPRSLVHLDFTATGL